MAELNESVDAGLAPQGVPALNPGRPADKPGDIAAETEAQQETADGALLRQRKLRLMLRQCDRVVLLDFNLLAMPGWPDNYSVAMARRKRDLWLLAVCLAAVAFLGGLAGSVPAWFAGGGFGVFVVTLLLGVPLVRQIYTDRPSYLDLIVHRRQLLLDARKHVGHLEGVVGLAWQCEQMKEFNPALKSPQFYSLIDLSARHKLSDALTRREHIRLYLVFMLEAEKAYDRLQQAFFEGSQSAIDQGRQNIAAESMVKS